jgi:hypothetical protein
MKAYRGVDVQLHSFLISGLGGNEMLNFLISGLGGDEMLNFLISGLGGDEMLNLLISGLGGDEMLNFKSRLIYPREGTAAGMKQKAAAIRTPDSQARNLVTI